MNREAGSVDGKPKVFIDSKNSKCFIDITSNCKTRTYQSELTPELQNAISELIA